MLKDKNFYKNTLRLPSSNFQMRANLYQREPDFINFWEQKNVYKKQENRQSKNISEKLSFILHDGPPYANGHLHLGHALNKIIKDIILRSKILEGYSVFFKPGWDCHGLPIEWKIEEELEKTKRDKNSIESLEFRRLCRDFAEKWVSIQKEEFKRFGILASWDDVYKTMDKKAEAQIIREFFYFLENNYVYRSERPVMWSVKEKTALADAEVVYQAHNTDSIYVCFPVSKKSVQQFFPSLEKESISLLAWTTTPWSIPANRALAFSREIKYGIYKIQNNGNNLPFKKNGYLILADVLTKAVEEKTKIKLEFLASVDSMHTLEAYHPLYKDGYQHNIPCLEGSFVSQDTGTGIVHIAPEHGPEDYELSIKNNITFSSIVREDGRYIDSVPLFSKRKILDDKGNFTSINADIIKHLIKNETLVYKENIQHSFPHSWRSLSPLIYRCTKQWFIRTEEIRQEALLAIETVNFFPKISKNRLKNMVKTRPDWLISRQRAWGVPIPILIDKKTKKPLIDEKVNKNIINAFEEFGSDIWFSKPASYFVSERYDAENYEKVEDILDVWFESGCTHSFALKENQRPCDLCVEGSDQHRGWFQSSLLESVATHKISPYKSLLTHGFVVDQNGRKLSKSSGNAVSLDTILKKYGADVLRLWVAHCDITQDIKMGEDILNLFSDTYRKIRNTFRYMLGNIEDVNAKKLPFEKLPNIEKFILSKLSTLDPLIRDAYKSLNIKNVSHTLTQFCSSDLSSFYFDIRKDCLYCDDKNSIEYKASQTVLVYLLEFLLRWFAPIIPFTTEEVWQISFPSHQPLNLESFMPETLYKNWIINSQESKIWENIQNLRHRVNTVLNDKRQAKEIGSGLDVDIIIYVQSIEEKKILEQFSIDDVLIVSNVKILVDKNKGSYNFEIEICKEEKCERCWKKKKYVSDNKSEKICFRCSQVLKNEN